MILTGKEIWGENILSGAAEDNIQMQGIDLRIDSISKLEGVGALPKEGKTILPKTVLIEPLTYKGKGKEEAVVNGWMLTPGVYDITFIEGINIPNNRLAMLGTRSSLVRQGVEVKSGPYDAGFKTEKGGAMLYVTRSVVIAQGASVAQIIVYKSNEVDKTYDGQYQGDVQREGQKSEE